MKPIFKFTPFYKISSILILNLHGIMELICEFIGLILQSIKLIYQSTSSVFRLFSISEGLVVIKA